jgi:hypothetical protein
MDAAAAPLFVGGVEWVFARRFDVGIAVSFFNLHSVGDSFSDSGATTLR